MHEELHARRRLPRTRRAWALAALAAAGALAVPAAWAAHRFADVPNSNPHHADVGAIAEAGITQGCNPPANTLYCPEQAVRRDQMASFLGRGLGRAALADRNIVQLPADGSFQDIRSVEIDTGGVAGGTGYVFVSATYTSFVNNLTGCPCRANFRIRAPDVTDSSDGSMTQITALAGSGGFVGGANSYLFEVPTGTTQTFVLQGQLVAGTGAVGVAGHLVALYVPFGSRDFG